MKDRIQRNEKTASSQEIWKAVDRGAEKAPQKVLERLGTNQRTQQSVATPARS